MGKNSTSPWERPSGAKNLAGFVTPEGASVKSRQTIRA